MSIASLARLSSSLSIVGLLLAMILSASSLSTPPRKGSGPGTYGAAGLAPHGQVSHCRLVVDGGRRCYIRELDLNGTPFLEGVDYTIAGDGSNQADITFLTRPLAGDRVEVLGATLESGLHTGSLSFY